MSHREKEIKTITHCLFVLKEFISNFMVCWLLFKIDSYILMTHYFVNLQRSGLGLQKIM